MNLFRIFSNVQNLFSLCSVHVQNVQNLFSTCSVYKKICLIRSLKKFIFRYQDLVKIYSVSAETIITMHFHIVKMYKDKEVNKNVKNIFFINV